MTAIELKELYETNVKGQKSLHETLAPLINKELIRKTFGKKDIKFSYEKDTNLPRITLKELFIDIPATPFLLSFKEETVHQAIRYILSYILNTMYNRCTVNIYYVENVISINLRFDHERVTYGQMRYYINYKEYEQQALPFVESWRKDIMDRLILKAGKGVFPEEKILIGDDEDFFPSSTLEYFKDLGYMVEIEPLPNYNCDLRIRIPR